MAFSLAPSGLRFFGKIKFFDFLFTLVLGTIHGHNRGAGACMGAQCRGLPNGSRVRVEVGE